MLAIVIISVSSFSMDLPGSSRKDFSAVSTLVVNANVTVILVNNSRQPVVIKGDDFFKDQVSVEQKDGAWVINSRKDQNLKTRGVVYIPANGLEQIQVNSAANIRSSNTLRMPLLRILINGNCRVHIATLGKIDFVENDFYQVDYRVWPSPDEFEAVIVKSSE